jgi:hypothetical protein
MRVARPTFFFILTVIIIPIIILEEYRLRSFSCRFFRLPLSWFPLNPNIPPSIFFLLITRFSIWITCMTVQVMWRGKITEKSDVDIGKMLHFINISRSLKYKLRVWNRIEIQNIERIFSSFSLVWRNTYVFHSVSELLTSLTWPDRKKTDRLDRPTAWSNFNADGMNVKFLYVRHVIFFWEDGTDVYFMSACSKFLA